MFPGMHRPQSAQTARLFTTWWRWAIASTYAQAMADARPDLVWHWQLVAECESGGDWHINTGNGYYGGLQFSLPTWYSVGGRGLPSDNTPGEQAYRADILRVRSGLGQWPVCGVHYRP